jgi:2-dehydropantoate 2-reductase
LPEQIRQPVDLAVIFVKSHQTARAAEAAAAVLKAEGVALTLQNGIGNVERLEARLGRGNVLAGVTSHGGTLLGPGRVRHAGKGPTVLGFSEAHADTINRIARVFDRAGIETRVEQNLERLIWGKLVVNAGINALAAILRVQNGVLGSEKACEPLMARAVAEAAAVAKRLGVTLPYEDPLTHVKNICAMTSQNRASMLQDILRGAPTEISAINGAIVQKGRELGIETPGNQLLTEIITAMEATANTRVS